MISVAMATYNGEKYIIEQLESVVRQSIKPDEIVIVDDCSSDKTIDLINNFKTTTDIQTIIIKNEKNIGYIKTFIKAINVCRGDVIVLCDQDDIWENGKIKDIEEFFKHNQDAMSIHYDIDVIDNEKNVVMKRVNNYRGERKYTVNEFCKKLNYCGMSSAFRSDIKKDLKKINVEKLPTHDWTIHAIALSHEGLYVSDKINCHRRSHGENAALKIEQTARMGIEQRKDIVNNYLIYYRLLKKIFEINVDGISNIALREISNYIHVTNNRMKYLNNRSIVLWLKNILNIKYYYNIKAYFCDLLYLLGVF